jgi:hypothetical protein
MSSAHVSAIFRLIELAKAVQMTYHRRSVFVAQAIQQSTQHYAKTCVKMAVLAWKEAVKARGNQLPMRDLDIQAALELLMKASAGPSTRLRRLACEIATQVAIGSKVRGWYLDGLAVGSPCGFRCFQRTWWTGL